MEFIHKITHANSKIYVGKDLTDNIYYFDNADSKSIEENFVWEQRRDFMIWEDVLREFKTASGKEVNLSEGEYI